MVSACRGQASPESARAAQLCGAFELIAGVVDDGQFGPVILFGHGGTAVEVVNDKAFGLPPLNIHLAHGLIARTGCDLLTISPEEQMENAQGKVGRPLSPENAKASEEKKIHLDEKTFRWMHNEDAMASDKLAEGIRRFYADARKLEQFAQAKLAKKMAG